MIEWNRKFHPENQDDVNDLIEYYRRDMQAGSLMRVTILDVELCAKIVAIPDSDKLTLQLSPWKASGTLIY
jgi:hypothetical protein